jgi:hypothetical protein
VIKAANPPTWFIASTPLERGHFRRATRAGSAEAWNNAPVVPLMWDQVKDALLALQFGMTGKDDCGGKNPGGSGRTGFE